MSTYLLIDLLIIILPLIVSFFPPIFFYKKFPYVLFSLSTGGLFFVSWDIVATLRGDWSFNPAHVMGISFAGLPLEEVLFFIFVPYSLLLTYEQAVYLCRDRSVPWKQGLGYAAGMTLVLLSFLFTGKNYTFMAVFSLGVVVILFSLLYPGIMMRLAFWIILLVALRILVPYVYYTSGYNAVIGGFSEQTAGWISPPESRAAAFSSCRLPPVPYRSPFCLEDRSTPECIIVPFRVSCLRVCTPLCLLQQ